MESFRVVNKVPTKVLTFGKGVGDDLLSVKHLILLIPGNPGVIDYYREFMKDLYVKLKSKYPKMHIPVWGISHAGHQTEGSQDFTFPYLNENPELYNLDGQCDHKVRFIDLFIPAHINVIGIGHSIGCKMWLETIKRMDEHKNSIVEPKKRPKVSTIYMLFPTIERMRHTPNATPVWTVLQYFKFLTPVIWSITVLPLCIQRWFVNLYFSGKHLPECAIPATLQLFNLDIIKRCAFLAKCELEQVVELDVDAIAQYLEKFHFYFGTTDGWCPLIFVDGMKEKFPKLQHQVCENGYSHAFILENSVGMANYICGKILIDN